jgi:hypothetical protein
MIDEIRLFSDYGFIGLLTWFIVRYIMSKLDDIHRCLEELRKELRESKYG